METGRFGASVGEVARLLDHYGVYEELRAELLSRVVARTDGLDGAWTVRAGGASRRQGQVQGRGVASDDTDVVLRVGDPRLAASTKRRAGGRSRG